MRIIAFVLDPPTIERILRHIDLPHQPPAVLPARSPPQTELAIGGSRDCVAIQFNQDAGANEWPDLDQTAGAAGDPWD